MFWWEDHIGAHREKGKGVSTGENQVHRAAATWNCKAAFTLPFICALVLCSGKTAGLSKGPRKSGTQCPPQLMCNVSPFPSPVGHTGPCETEILPLACCPAGNPGLITFSSNICTGGSQTHTDSYLAWVTCFWREYFSNTKCTSLCKPLHILSPLSPYSLDHEFFQTRILMTTTCKPKPYAYPSEYIMSNRMLTYPVHRCYSFRL